MLVSALHHFKLNSNTRSVIVMEFSQYLLGLHKSQGVNFGNASGSQRVQKRVLRMNEKRKNTRLDFLMSKRKISATDIGECTPFERKQIVSAKKQKKMETKTPQPEPAENQSRRAMLKKWKEEKEKKKKEEKKKSKPLFKVYHCEGLPSVETALQTLKGKEIPSAKKNFPMFPTSSQFRAPSNIKPIELKYKSARERNSSAKKTSSLTILGPLTRRRLNFKTEEVSSPKTTSKRNVSSQRKQEVKNSVSKSNKKMEPSRKPKSVKISQAQETSRDSTPSPPRPPKARKRTTPHPKKKKPAETISKLESSIIAISDSGDDTGKNEVTPKEKSSPPVYISPFVTVSRGKNSARKEFLNRSQSREGTKEDLDGSRGKKAGAAYFRFTLDNEIEKLQKLCDEWASYKEQDELPDGAPDMIDVAIGQTQLLIAKKFKQFRGLIDSCEYQTEEKPVTLEDLHGFWDMVYIQVKNLEARFTNLKTMKENNWEEILPSNSAPVAVQPTKKRGRPPKKLAASSSLRNAIKAARQKAKNGEKAEKEELNKFDGGFFKIESPRRTPSNVPQKQESATRRSLLSNVLVNQNRRSSTKGLAMMNVSQSAKKIYPVNTPPKSILKPSRSKSTTRKSKVVFADSANKENIDKDDDGPIRRSTRLTRRTLCFES